MNDGLNATLAVSKQQYEELTRLVPIQKLRELDFGDDAKRKRVACLLASLYDALATIERELRKAKDGVPVVPLAASHIRFWRDHLEPNAMVIRRAHWECIGILEILGPLGEWEFQRPHPFKDTITSGLERWRDMIDNDMIEDLQGSGFDIDSAMETIQLPWFDPDRWLENMSLLRPVLLDRPPQQIRDHVRHRLMEIYRAFTFGLWMSSVALCRSLLEYSLKDTASTHGIERSKIGYRGEKEDRSMQEFCEDFSTRFPPLGKALEQVRSAGNRIMHAKKHDIVSFPKVLREEALASVSATRQVLETVYARASE